MIKITQKARRRIISVVAILVLLIILISVTFAWQSFSQFGINNADDSPYSAGGRLHDDFEDNQNWTEGANKDIYIENFTGQNPEDPEDYGRPIFVRIQLSEYMELGEGAGLFNYEGGTDGYHELDQGGQRTVHPGNHAVSLIPISNILDPSTWVIHNPYAAADSSAGLFHTYWEWNEGGQKVFMPTFNRDNSDSENGNATDRTQYAHKEFTVGQTLTGSTQYYDESADAVISQSETHKAKMTLDTAAVLTMAQWKALGSPMADPAGSGYWVYDMDGWAYWSKALMPGDATGLLLSGITLFKEPDFAWYYAIHVKAQMASAGDWGDESAGTGFYEDGITSNGLFLLNQAAGRSPTITGITINEGSNVFVRAGDPVTLSATVDIRYPSGDPGETLVKWTISPSTPGFNGSTLQTDAGDAGNTYIVTATTIELPEAKSADCTIIVYPDEGVRIVEGAEDGKFYVDFGDNTYKEISLDGTLGGLKCAGKDRTIGNADDVWPVYVNNSGVKLLGPNEDGSYFIMGKDLMLGTEDDPKVWPGNYPAQPPDLDDLLDYNPDSLNNYQVLVTQVSVGAPNVVPPGGKIVYSAEVTNASSSSPTRAAITNQNVKWELIGSYASGTSISPNNTFGTGNMTLTVGAAQAAGSKIIIKVTSQEGDAENTIIVTVIGYDLFYSENASLIGDDFTINLASPIGASTTRYFTTRNAENSNNYSLAASNWVLADVSGTPIAGNVSRTTVVDNQIYGVTIKAGYTGVFTFKIGAYVVTFNVTTNGPEQAVADVGETFKAANKEWRVLAKDSVKGSLIITEHMITTAQFHSFDPYVGWTDTPNNPAIKFNTLVSIFNEINTADSTFANKIQNTTLITRNFAYGSAASPGVVNDYNLHPLRYTTSVNNKLFLLSFEETNYGLRRTATMPPYGNNAVLANNDVTKGVATTGTANMRTSGDHVLFGDVHARKASLLGTTAAITISHYYWTRSPSFDNNTYVTMVEAYTGYMNDTRNTSTIGVRPSCWIIP